MWFCSLLWFLEIVILHSWRKGGLQKAENEHIRIEGKYQTAISLQIWVLLLLLLFFQLSTQLK